MAAMSEAAVEVPAGYETLHQEGEFAVFVDSSEIAKLAGNKPALGDRISVHYTGKFLDGEEFDSSYKRERPFIFEVGQGRVISCWDQAF